MNNRKARFLVRFLGRTGTQVFCGLLGAGLVVVGILLALDVIERAE